MIPQELIDWIKEEKRKGYTAEQLHDILMKYDNEEEEVSGALKIVFEQVILEKNEFKFNLFILVGITIVTLIAGGIFFYMFQGTEKDIDIKNNIEEVKQEVVLVEESKEDVVSTDKEDIVANEEEIPDKEAEKPTPTKEKPTNDLSVLGPYDEMENLELTDDLLSFTYNKNGEYYYKINNQALGPYDKLYVSYDDFKAVFDVMPRPTPETPKNRPMGFFMYEKDGQKYYNADGQSFIANDYYLIHGNGPSSVSQLKVS